MGICMISICLTAMKSGQFSGCNILLYKRSEHRTEICIGLLHQSCTLMDQQRRLSIQRLSLLSAHYAVSNRDDGCSDDH